MKLIDQVASLSLCQQLKTLGVKQESYAEWLYQPFDDSWMVFPRFENALGYSAFTCSELGEMLPRKKFIQSATESDNHLQITKNIDGCFIAGYVNHDNGQLHHITISENEANTRAALLVFLLENQLMELPE
jgi:hypothetical protein